MNQEQQLIIEMEAWVTKEKLYPVYAAASAARAVQLACDMEMRSKLALLATEQKPLPDAEDALEMFRAYIACTKDYHARLNDLILITKGLAEYCFPESTEIDRMNQFKKDLHSFVEKQAMDKAAKLLDGM